jgi:hypothetical protein
MKNMSEFIVHVSVEQADSMVEEKLRYTANKEKQTYTIDIAETFSKNGYAILEGPLAQLAEFCANQAEE